MALAFARTFAGFDPAQHSRQTEPSDADAAAMPQPTSTTRQARPSRRATSHYNHFQTSCSVSTDDPPTYAAASRHPPRSRQNTTAAVAADADANPDPHPDPLPAYSCTVAAEGKVLLQLESINPLHAVAESEWREVYMVLRGTFLSFHRPKDHGPGRLLRSYTLQHAEVGAAPDTQHTVLQPQSKLAHLIPALARHKAWRKDPSLFAPVRQHILRLRVELDQLLLADPSEERTHSLIHAIGAAIDISPAIDERSIPRQCTVPRRPRRRNRNHNRAATGNLEDPALIAEQERLLRDMYPAFAEQRSAEPEVEQIAITRTVTVESAEPSSAIDEQHHRQRPPSSPTAFEEDELDLAVMREDFANPSSAAPPPPRQSSLPANNDRPGVSRQSTSTSVNSALSTIPATQPSNLCRQTGKWRPQHNRTPEQVHRYIKRCLPVLQADAPRPSDILICHGKRVKINWRMAMLDEWELKPPSYKAHGFDRAETAERGDDHDHANNRRSVGSESMHLVDSVQSAESEPCHNRADYSSNCESARQRSQDTSSNSGADNDSSDDHIQPAETTFAHLHLSKTPSSDASVDRKSASGRRQERRDEYAEAHGMVFCF